MTTTLSLRFFSTPALRARLAAWVDSGAPKRSEQHLDFLDTADFALRARDLVCTVERGEHGGGASPGPQHRSTLIRHERRGGWVEAIAIEPTVLDSDFIVYASAQLERTDWRVETAHGVISICALHGRLRTASGPHPLDSISLSVEGDDAAALVGFAHTLSAGLGARCALRITARPLGLQVMDSVRTRPPPVVHASRFELTATMNCEQAFTHIVHQCVTLYCDNEQGLVHGDDPESVHQARVALRQLGSALSLFKPMLAASPTEHLQAQLRWLAHSLGAVRDWEVLRTETIRATPDHVLNDTQRDAIDDAVGIRITAARQALARAVRSARYGKLQLLLTEWVVASPWREPAGSINAAQLQQTVGEYAHRELERRRARLLRRARRLGRATDEQRHELRIAAKKLRYSVDFLGSLYEAAAVAAYLRPLRRVQDVLGALNDIHVAHERLRDLAAIPMQSTHAPIRSLALEHHLNERRSALIDRLTRVWDRFAQSAQLAQTRNKLEQTRNKSD